MCRFIYIEQYSTNSIQIQISIWKCENSVLVQKHFLIKKYRVVIYLWSGEDSGPASGSEVCVGDGDSSQLHDLGVGDAASVVAPGDGIVIAHTEAGPWNRGTQNQFHPNTGSLTR